MVEKLVLRQPPDAKPETRSAAELIRRKIARRAAAEFQDGMNINLGTYIEMEPLAIVMSFFEFGLTCRQWWANLDQASKHLEVFRFRDLSPTPIP